MNAGPPDARENAIAASDPISNVRAAATPAPRPQLPHAANGSKTHCALTDTDPGDAMGSEPLLDSVSVDRHVDWRPVILPPRRTCSPFGSSYRVLARIANDWGRAADNRPVARRCGLGTIAPVPRSVA